MRPKADDTDVLLDALDRLHCTGPEYGGFLANHGPMAAEAMLRLGAANSVATWVDRYLPRLMPAVEPGHAVTSDNWRDHVGDIRRLGDWNHYFQNAARDGD